jgi:mersacidin/lichenicidin family type 2 lantibiotic
MKLDIVRAWKNETYRQSLSDEQRAALPANPVGELELTDAQLETACGGFFGGAGAQLVTFAVECENTVFSLNFNNGESLFSFPINVCINNE